MAQFVKKKGGGARAGEGWVGRGWCGGNGEWPSCTFFFCQRAYCVHNRAYKSIMLTWLASGESTGD